MSLVDPSRVSLSFLPGSDRLAPSQAPASSASMATSAWRAGSTSTSGSVRPGSWGLCSLAFAPLTFPSPTRRPHHHRHRLHRTRLHLRLVPDRLVPHAAPEAAHARPIPARRRVPRQAGFLVGRGQAGVHGPDRLHLGSDAVRLRVSLTVTALRKSSLADSPTPAPVRSICLYGFSTFLPVIIKALGSFSSIESNLLTAPV